MKTPILLKAILGILLFIGLIAGTGYLYFVPTNISKFAERVETAISGPELIAIAYFDTHKMQRILNFIEGTPDPSEIQKQETSSDTAMSKLYDGSFFLNHDLNFVMGSIHRFQEQNIQTLYISANDSTDPFMNAFKNHFSLEPVPNFPNWFSVKAKDLQKPGELNPCPVDPKSEKQDSAKSPHSIKFLYASNKIILLSNELTYANSLLTKIANKETNQPHLEWTEYRKQKLAAFMVINPKASAESASGMESYLAKKYLEKNSSIQALAGSLNIDLVQKNLGLDLSLFSKDSKYKEETLTAIEKYKTDVIADSAKFSKTLTEFLSGVKTQNSEDRLSISFSVGAGAPQKLRSILEEVLTSAFQPLNIQMSDQNPSEEKIQDKPIDYKTNQAFQNFLKGSIKDDSNLGAHFMEGPFLASAYEMKFNQKQELQLVVQGKIAVPKELIENLTGNLTDRQITASLMIESVNSNNQKSVLVDERCVDKNTMMGSSLNHEAETFISSIQNETISINKALRLLANTQLEDIQEIKGKLSIQAPTVVQSFPLALKVEEAIEQKNFRFFISKLTPDSVTYTISGEREKLLEVRAYNKDGKALRNAGKFEINRSGKITQSYHGKIQKLEIFVAQEFVEHSKAFLIKGPLKGKIENKELLKTRPPQAIHKKTWDQTKGLNASTLKTDPNDWNIYSGSKSPRASQSLGNIQLYLTHTTEGWDNQPKLHIYHPFIPELSEVMSALTLNLEAKLATVPAETKKLQQIHLLKYSYAIPSGEPVIQHRVLNQAYLLQNVLLNLDLKEGQKLESLQGSLKFHLPTKISSQKLTLDQLWKSVEVSGMKITLEKIDLSFMKGSHIRIEGNLEKLVNLYIKDSRGQLWKSDQTFIQRDGSVTLVLPLVEGVAEYELFLVDAGYLVEVPVGMRVGY